MNLESDINQKQANFDSENEIAFYQWILLEEVWRKREQQYDAPVKITGTVTAEVWTPILAVQFTELTGWYFYR